MNQNLVDIRDVNINTELPVSKKLRSFIDQIKDPYHFKCGEVEITLGFDGDEILENKIIKHLSSK